MKSPAPLAESIVREAIDWMLRTRSGDHEILEHCQRWRAAHADHEQAWQRVQALDHELGSHLRHLPGASVALRTLDRTARELDRRRALKLLGLAAIGSSAAWLAREQRPWEQWTSDLVTATGERRGLELPGGVRLELDTQTAVDLDYPAGHPRVTLKQGEILLACPAQSPEVQVRSADTVLTSTGGRFVVGNDDHGTLLGVLSGRVNMALAQGKQWAEAGQYLRIQKGIARVLPAPDMDLGAWAEGLIVTRGMRLGDFVAQVARYRRGILHCDDSVADLRLSGVYRLDDTDKLLDVLQQTLPVDVQRRTRWWVRLSHRA